MPAMPASAARRDRCPGPQRTLIPVDLPAFRKSPNSRPQAAPRHRRCWTMISLISPLTLTPPPLPPPRRRTSMPPRPQASASVEDFTTPRPACLTPAPSDDPGKSGPRRRAAAIRNSPHRPASKTAALKLLKRASAAADARSRWPGRADAGLCWAAGRCGVLQQ